MYSIVLLNSFLGWLVISFFGSFLGSKGSFYILFYLGVITFVFSVFAFVDVGVFGNFIFSKYWYWFVLSDLYLDVGLLFDSLTVVMLLMVSSMSLLVYTYSLDYMAGDRHISSFFSFLSLFSFFMFVLVSAPSFLQMFIGWEGVGLASYLLINFWSSSLLANKAAFKAMIFNSLGDYCLSLSICMIQMNFGSINYSVVFSLVPYISTFDSFSLLVLSCLLFMAACGKSAQLGLHFWLPDAMEGPTRVSALIHAATMVTSGIYVLMSCSPMLEFCRTILMVISILGGVTAIVCALIGLVQLDIKKVIAFSTCSQLGYMCLSCGLSLYEIALYHLFTHAIFKALLFLSAGGMIHSLQEDQSLLKYGGLIVWMPWVYVCVFTGSLALGGLPFLSGYYSKDTILELVSSSYFSWVVLLWFLDSFAAGITVLYSVKVISLVFFVGPKYRFNLFLSGISDSSFLMSLVFIPLFLGSMVLGYLFQGVFLSEGSDFWGNSIYFNSLSFGNSFLDFHWSSQFVKLMPSLFGVGGVILCLYWLSLNLVNSFVINQFLVSFLFSSFYLDSLVNLLVLQVNLVSNSLFFQLVDKGLLDILGVTGSGSFFGSLLKVFSLLTVGHIYNMVFLLFFVLVFSLGFSLF